MTTTLTTVTPSQAHAQALQAWREGQRAQATTDMASRLDTALLQAIEKRALEVITTLGE